MKWNVLLQYSLFNEVNIEIVSNLRFGNLEIYQTIFLVKYGLQIYSVT